MNDSKAAPMNAATIEPTAPPASAIKVTAPLPPTETPDRRRDSRRRKARDRELADDLANLARQAGLFGSLVPRANRLDDDPTDRAHLVGAEASRGDGRRADADPGSRVRGKAVEWDRVLVDGYPDLVEQ